MKFRSTSRAARTLLEDENSNNELSKSARFKFGNEDETKTVMTTTDETLSLKYSEDGTESSFRLSRGGSSRCNGNGESNGSFSTILRLLDEEDKALTNAQEHIVSNNVLFVQGRPEMEHGSEPTKTKIGHNKNRSVTVDPHETEGIVNRKSIKQNNQNKDRPPTGKFTDINSKNEKSPKDVTFLGILGETLIRATEW